MQKINKFNDNLNIIGPKIKYFRKQKKITQEDLCARMQVMGYQISRSDISKIENGKKFIADFEVLGFANALKISILDLYRYVAMSSFLYRENVGALVLLFKSLVIK